MIKLFRFCLIGCFAFFIFIPINVDANYYADFPKALKQKLENKKQQLGSSYQPRTKHISEDGKPIYTNRLLLEESPYLLQHAHNPVNWHSWSEETFNIARQQNKLIFLSIGYSTCHWCHVMEHESFENIEIAKLLNLNFISIKVDRERRPDIDATYMTAINIVNKRGGWPASLFLTNEGKPFVATTYIRPAQFKQLIHDVAQTWEQQPDNILTYADELHDTVSEYLNTHSTLEQLKKTTSSQAMNLIIARYDEFNGGFGDAPKFPSEPKLLFLLHQLRQQPSQDLYKILSLSLHAMAQGGIYDQVGGGFHRYATDPHWNIPHFEKMLYTQAQLSKIYLDLYALSADPEFALIGKEILTYVKREMTSPKGGFYSATDADSEGKEGEYFVWKLNEMKTLLPHDLYTLAIDIFNATKNGNFEGSNILHRTLPLISYAENNKITQSALQQKLDRIKTALYTKRNHRVKPLRDEKIITAWNGLMIEAFAHGFNILNEPEFLSVAIEAAEFIWNHNRNKNNNLLRSFYAVSGTLNATQDDYAHYINALITLYDVTNDNMWLTKSESLAGKMLEHFWDQKNGGFYLNYNKNNFLNLTRVKDRHDGAIISANAAAIRALNRLAKRTGESVYETKAKQTIASFATEINALPEAYPGILLADEEIKHGALSNITYAAEGNVKIVAKPNHNNDIDINITLQPGWHINSQVTHSKDYLPTVISIDNRTQGWKFEKVTYPLPQNIEVTFEEKPLSVFSEDIKIIGKLKNIETNKNKWLQAIPINIMLQACNDEICLLPEELTIYAQIY